MTMITDLNLLKGSVKKEAVIHLGTQGGSPPSYSDVCVPSLQRAKRKSCVEECLALCARGP